MSWHKGTDGSRCYTVVTIVARIAMHGCGTALDARLEDPGWQHGAKMESASTQGEWAFRQRGWRRMVAEWGTREDARMKMEAMAHDGPRPSPSAAWTETLIISRRSNNDTANCTEY